MNRRRIICRILLALYLLMMAVLLFYRPVPNRAVSYWTLVRSQLNLRPLHTIRLFWALLSRPGYSRPAVINLVGNVVMFLPLGLLLPPSCQKTPRLWKTLLSAGLLIIAVEIAQLFTLRGSCDVDDLILNLLGTAMGYGLFRLIGTRRHHPLCR